MEYIIENADLVAFWKMGVEDQNAILRAKMDYPDSVELFANKWKKSGGDGICFSSIYRVRVIDTPLVIPWEIISPKWDWAAMDQDGRVFVYVEEPRENSGNQYIGGLARDIDFLNIDTTGIDWRRSKTRRPV